MTAEVSGIGLTWPRRKPRSLLVMSTCSGCSAESEVLKVQVLGPRVLHDESARVGSIYYCGEYR